MIIFDNFMTWFQCHCFILRIWILFSTVIANGMYCYRCAKSASSTREASSARTSARRITTPTRSVTNVRAAPASAADASVPTSTSASAAATIASTWYPIHSTLKLKKKKWTKLKFKTFISNVEKIIKE